MSTEAAVEGPRPSWKPLSATDRRVIGVLVEKAKTTPDQYPLTVNSLRTGANQKSNRFPLMELEAEQVEEALERLRGLGAVVEVQDSGRALKYRHRMYEWLGVDKVELAIMAELLLRGAQTVGELRGRAARMEPIADMAALKPLLDGLVAKGLVVYFTAEGRGAVVSHNLYSPQELERLRQEHRNAPGEAGGAVERPSRERVSNDGGSASVVEELRRELAEIRSVLAQHEERTTELAGSVAEIERQLRGL